MLAAHFILAGLAGASPSSAAVTVTDAAPSADSESTAWAYSGRSAATASVTERIGVFWLVLASDFTLRSAAKAAPARATSSASAPAAYRTLMPQC